MRRALCCVLVACGGGDTDGPAADAPAANDAFDTARCLIAGDYGDLGTKMGTTSLGPTTSTIVVDAGPPRDSFFLKLTSGKGVFSGGLSNGTFTIAGAELSNQTCGVCVNLLADIGNMGPQKFYFADGGTVTLSSTTPPAGSIANVTIHEVDSGGQEILGGCAGSIDAMAFTTQ